MSAFVLERLFPTGWRRDGQLFWRLEDAADEAERLVREHEVRGVRILSVKVSNDAVVERLARRDEGVDHA